MQWIAKLKEWAGLTPTGRVQNAAYNSGEEPEAVAERLGIDWSMVDQSHWNRDFERCHCGQAWERRGGDRCPCDP